MSLFFMNLMVVISLLNSNSNDQREDCNHNTNRPLPVSTHMTNHQFNLITSNYSLSTDHSLLIIRKLTKHGNLPALIELDIPGCLHHISVENLGGDQVLWLITYIDQFGDDKLDYLWVTFDENGDPQDIKQGTIPDEG